jgi:hypothetical protein
VRQLARFLGTVRLLHPGLLQAMAADEFVIKHIEARGGLAKLAAIRLLRPTGTIVFGGGDGQIEAKDVPPLNDELRRLKLEPIPAASPAAPPPPRAGA